MAADANGDRLAGVEETLPGQALQALLEFGESSGVEKISQARQDAAGGAQVQVGAVQLCQAAAEFDPAGGRWKDNCSDRRPGWSGGRLRERSTRVSGSRCGIREETAQFLGGEGFKSGGGYCKK
jgi:hypothetical protein